MKRHYKNPNPVKQGFTRYVVKYRYNGVEFSSEEDATSNKEARAMFKRTHSYLAEIYSITKKR